MTSSLKPNSATALTPRVSRSRQLPVRAYLPSDVPPNVAEARAWIAAWKSRQAPVIAATIPETPQFQAVLPNVAEARQWIAAWKARRSLEALLPPSAAPAPVAAAVMDSKPEATEAMPAVKVGPKVAADGTLTFHKEMLDGVSVEELLKKLTKLH